jgi:hypothetical protein
MLTQDWKRSLSILCFHRVPGGADKLNEDHKIVHKQLDELLACFEEIKKKPADFEKVEELSLVLPSLVQIHSFLPQAYRF